MVQQPPKQSSSVFETIGNALAPGPKGLVSKLETINDGGYGFDSRSPASQSGAGTRQAQVPPNRGAFSTRQVMRWMVPEQPMIEMYINPNNVQYKYKKLITPQRVKGGYTLQYWGEDLGTLAIGGTTGTSGIEGINVLLDVYRNEQLMFDPYALFLQAERDKAEEAAFDDLLGFPENGLLGSFGTEIGNLTSSITGSGVTTDIANTRNRPNLATMAFTVEMYWSGEVYRGYFEDFSFTEKADMVGLFDYSFNFKVTQKRGIRNNFLAWHKHPSYGQSESNAAKSPPPHSFSLLLKEQGTPGQSDVDQPNLFKQAKELGQDIYDAFDIF